VSDAVQPAESTADDRGFRGIAWLVGVAAGAVVFGIMLRTDAVLCPNDASRWDTIWSLVEKGTYVIDEAPWGTIDKVHRDGHDYSSKIALLPTILAGEYWVIKRLTKWKIEEKTERVCRIILLTVNVIPLILYVGLLGQLIARYTESPWWRGYWLVAAAFGTYVTGYSVTLNDHSVGAISALVAFYFAVRVLYIDEPRWFHFAMAGFFTAFTACNQLPAAIFSLALFIWLLVRQPKGTLLFFIPAATLPVAGFLVTTYLSTGGFVPYYLYKDTELYQYEGSYWSDPQGIDGLDEPKHIYLFNLLLGHHGFFTLTPIFILGVVAFALGLRSHRFEGRIMPWFMLAAFVAAVVLYLLKTGPSWSLVPLVLLSAVAFVSGIRANGAETAALAWFVFSVSLATIILNTLQTDNYGGVCHGFRYLIWPVPLWITLGSLKADAYGGSRWVKVLAVLFLFVAIVSMGCSTDNPWTDSWLEDLSKDLGSEENKKWHGKLFRGLGWGTY
jgi:hypothetical protein